MSIEQALSLLKNGNIDGCLGILEQQYENFELSDCGSLVTECLPFLKEGSPFVARAVVIIGQIVSSSAKTKEGPCVIAPMILAVLKQTNWWQTDLKLINMLFTTLKKAFAANYQLEMHDGKVLIRITIEKISESMRTSIGRATRFFLSFLSDLIHFGGAHEEDSSCLQIGIGVLKKCCEQKNPTEHVGPLDSATQVFVQRLLKWMTPENVKKCLIYLDSLNHDIGAFRVLMIVSQEKLNGDLSDSLLSNTLQNALDSLSMYSEYMLDSHSIFNESYRGLATLMCKMSQGKVETFLFENMLSPHLVISNMLGNLWALFIRNAHADVQEKHLHLLLECIESFPESKRSLCRFRIIRIFRIVCVNCAKQARVKIASNENALYYFPPLANVDESMKELFGESMKKLAPSLASGGEVLPKLASVTRMGCLNVTHETAYPLSKSVSEIYLRVGNTMTMRERRSIMVLLSSLSSWFGANEFSKYLVRLTQTGSSSSPLMNVVLLQKLGHVIDSSFVQPMTILFHKALQESKWFTVICAVRSFHFLSTHCASLTEGDIQKLAGNHLTMIANCLGLNGRTLFASDLHLGSKLDSVSKAKLTTNSSNSNTNANQIKNNDIAVSVEGFARLSSSLIETAKQLQSLKDSEMIQSGRFQSDLSFVLSILNQLQKQEL